jgi:hypothetical protein
MPHDAVLWKFALQLGEDGGVDPQQYSLFFVEMAAAMKQERDIPERTEL